MIYKYTKCESVIAKIMADSDMSEKNMRVTDIREWIFEAIKKIGAPTQYIQRESGIDGVPIFEIHDYQIPLPDDMVHLTAVAYSTNPKYGWIPVRSESKHFKDHNKTPEPCVHQVYDTNNMTIEDIPEEIVDCVHKHHCHQPMQYKLPTTQAQFYGQNLSKYASRMLYTQEAKDVTMFIKPGWIVFNRKYGYVKLSYKAIATDERGYPLIPDLDSYQEAIYWYVMMKLNFSKFMKGTLGGKKNLSVNIYYYLQKQWNFYRQQAYVEAMMPSEPEMRSIKHEWNKLVPDWDSDDTFFESEGRIQLNFNDYYNGY